ncbi:MAG: hypothetical protein IJ781_09965 [Atopobiaceae bacterium]|nr:hypothetical protein [Atopobiaceae bacterium]
MSGKIFDGVEISDEALEGVAGGMMDLMGGETTKITVAHMVAGYKEKGMSYEAARADMLNVFAKLNEFGLGFTQEDIDRNMAEFDSIW